MAQQKQIRLGTMRWQVQSLASLSELRIWRYCELWCTLQTWLESCIAVAMVAALIQPLARDASICRGCGPKKKKKKVCHQDDCSFSTQRSRHILIYYLINHINKYLGTSGETVLPKTLGRRGAV